MPLFNYLKNNLSILDVISEYVQLKPAGNYWKGSCPFHFEKDASFTVSPDKQIFYCFGCHAKGDVISFIAKKENLSQVEAAKYIIEKHQLELPAEIQDSFFRKTGVDPALKNNYFGIYKLFAKWANEKLLQSNVALNYLKERNIDFDLIDYFKIGYFPGGIRNINHLLKEASMNGFMAKDLVEANLLGQGRSVIYSPFEERILFPINDMLSRCSGFGGRVFRPGDERAKYYNSKESLFFSKGKLLFGFDLAKARIQDEKSVYLVEGYTDCVAMAKYGYTNVVATLGTACTIDHLRILSRYVNTVFVLYDGDSAGQKAILRLTELCWGVNLELRIVKLPPKDDPASFLERGGDLKKLIDSSISIFAFFIDSTGNGFEDAKLADQMVAGRKILNLISKISDALKRELLMKQASIVMGLPVSSIKTLVFEEVSKKIDSREPIAVSGKTNLAKLDLVPPLEEQIFSVIINSLQLPEYLFIPEDLVEYFSDYVQVLLKKLHVFLKKNENVSGKFNLFVESLNELDKDWVVACSLKFDQKTSEQTFDELLMLFAKKNWKQIVQDVKLKMKKAQFDKDEERVKKLFTLFTQLKNGIKTRGLI